VKDEIEKHNLKKKNQKKITVPETDVMNSKSFLKTLIWNQYICYHIGKCNRSRSFGAKTKVSSFEFYSTPVSGFFGKVGPPYSYSKNFRFFKLRTSFLDFFLDLRCDESSSRLLLCFGCFSVSLLQGQELQILQISEMFFGFPSGLEVKGKKM